MHTFLGLDGRGRVLDIPQGRVPCLLLGLDRKEGRELWGMRRGSGENGRVWGGGEEVEIFINK